MTGAADVRAALALAAVLLLAACGAASGARSAGQGPPGGGPSPAATPMPTAPPIAPATPGAVPTPTPPARMVIARDQDNGHAVSMLVGDQLQLVLDGAWQPLGSTNPAVLRPAGQLGITPRYDALAPGRADVIAQRLSCGEAPSCTGERDSYRLTVIVLG
jgi:hypothetical protein